MTDPALIERITRSLAFMLRHQPESFDLELDPVGFSDLEDVVQALNERLGEPVEEEDVRSAVSAGDRPRYEIQGDRIRALYGHSIPVEPGPSSKPPEFLFVAVPEQELERARRFGLRGGRRRFLHLALTKDDAAESGRRASRDYTVLVIHALDAWEEGISFYDRVALWLAEEVPTHLIEVEGTYHDGTDPMPRRFDAPREQGSRERGYEQSGNDRGRRRGRGGRGRERQHGRQGEFRETRGSHARQGDSGRGGAREPERVQPLSAPLNDERAAQPHDASGREGGRGQREGSGQPSFAQERTDERGAGRREGRRDERRPERREARPEGRDGGRPAAREAQRERPEPLESGPRSAPAASGRGGFGAGLEAQEERREREARSAPPPRPSPPPRGEPTLPPENDRPGFGAGL